VGDAFLEHQVISQFDIFLGLGAGCHLALAGVFRVKFRLPVRYTCSENVTRLASYILPFLVL